MRIFIVFCTLWGTGFALCANQAQVPERKIVCYYSSWAIYRPDNGSYTISDIDPTLCTHIIYAFAGLNKDGKVVVLDPWNDLPDGGGHDGFNKFVGLRKLSPKTKFMVSIGGWSQGSVTFSNVVANSTLRSRFVENVVNFTCQHGFDGCDMDWEYPNQRNGTKADVENFVLLLKELRVAFDDNGLILSVATAAAEVSASLSYDIPGISESVDFINLMTYDFHLSTDPITGHNTPLYPATREKTKLQRSLNINAAVIYWLSHGAPPEKLVLGTAFYGKSFTLKNSAYNQPGSPATGPGQAGKYSQENGTLFYYEICERIANKGWNVSRDEEQRVPYAYRGDQWLSYDDVKSIIEKAKYIKKYGLGGAMVWSIDMDDFRGICGRKSPLLNILNNVLRKVWLC